MVAAFELDCVEPERGGVAFRFVEVEAGGDEDERLARCKSELEPFPLLADGHRLPPRAARRSDGNQLCDHAVAVCPHERRQRQFLPRRYAEPTAVGGEHAPDRLADRLVIIEPEHRQRLRRERDLKAVAAVARDGAAHLTFEAVKVAHPAAESVGVAAPVRAATLKTAVRHKVLHILRRDLWKPFLAGCGLAERDVVEPERAGALEPELQPARGGGQIVLGLKQKLEPLPFREGRKSIRQAGILPRPRVRQRDINVAALHAFGLCPERQPIPLAVAHGDAAGLCDHRVVGRSLAAESGAFEFCAAFPVVAGVER